MDTLRVVDAAISTQVQVTTPADSEHDPDTLGVAETYVTVAGRPNVRTGFVAFELERLKIVTL